jgi:hypothetical protein
MYSTMVPERNAMLALYKLREQDLIEEIQRKRLLQNAGFMSSSLLAQMMLGLGNVLYTAGKNLRMRYTPGRRDQLASTSANFQLSGVAYMGEASLVVCDPQNPSLENRSIAETPIGVATWIEVSDEC